jgi:hypothetical protein
MRKLISMWFSFRVGGLRALLTSGLLAGDPLPSIGLLIISWDGHRVMVVVQKSGSRNHSNEPIQSV